MSFLSSAGRSRNPARFLFNVRGFFLGWTTDVATGVAEILEHGVCALLSELPEDELNDIAFGEVIEGSCKLTTNGPW